MASRLPQVVATLVTQLEATLGNTPLDVEIIYEVRDSQPSTTSHHNLCQGSIPGKVWMGKDVTITLVFSGLFPKQPYIQLMLRVAITGRQSSIDATPVCLTFASVPQGSDVPGDSEIDIEIDTELLEGGQTDAGPHVAKLASDLATSLARMLRPGAVCSSMHALLH